MFSVLTTACPADSKKAYCKVCYNAIINRFFAFNCCKKDRNNMENLSDWTSFGAASTLRRQGSTIPFKMHHVLLSRAPASETYFPFFVKRAMQNYFHNLQVSCYFCATWYETRTTFFASLFSLEVKLLWRNAFACGKGWGR